MATEGLKDPLVARSCLVLGGAFGAHRLYLGHYPEAFIFLSTLGFGFLGVFYDSFFLNSLVHEKNEEIQGDTEDGKIFKNGRELLRLSRMVNWSPARFFLSVLYATWLGFLVFVAGSVTMERHPKDSWGLLFMMTLAVTAGVYLVGNSGRQYRSLLYIWIATITCALVVNYATERQFFKTLMMSSLFATIIGNRFARKRTVTTKPFNAKHFTFWASLFALLICVIAVGASKHILDKRVMASRPGESTVTTSLGGLLTDRFMDPRKVNSFFANAPKIEYRKSRTKKNHEQPWWEVDLAGKAPYWADLLTVFVVDLLRAETQVLEGKLKNLNASPYISDDSLCARCLDLTKANDKARNEEEDAVAVGRSLLKACELCTNQNANI